MSKKLSSFKPVAGFDGLYTAHSKTHCCIAVRLKSGELCLYSPVPGLSEAVKASLAAVGEVAFLLAPNFYHHKALEEYQNAYPRAQLCCPSASQTRLEKVTGLRFAGLAALTAALPDAVVLVETQGLKTGEVWFQVTHEDRCAWVITDAFCGPKDNGEVVAETLDMLTTFPKFGVGDKAIYIDWLNGEIDRGAPTLILPCHGAMVEGSDLGVQMRELVTDRL